MPARRPLMPSLVTVLLGTALLAGLAACTSSQGTATTATPPPTPAAAATSPSPGGACPPESTSPGCLAGAVVDAVVDRISVMPEVAAAKRTSGDPVRDPARERAVVRAFVTAATDRGVPAATARAVIRDQVDAAVNVQRGLLDAWASGALAPPAGPPPDLAADLRPRIDTATDALADGLARAYEAGIPPGWGSAVADAQGRALPTLPEGVTAIDLALALSTVSGL